MAIQFRPIGLPADSYSVEEESQFRRNLESYLTDISGTVNDSESANNGLASSASKRESLIPVPSSFRYPFTPSASSESPVALISASSIHYTGNPVLRIPDTVSSLDYIYGGSEGEKLTLVKVGSTNTVTVRESGTGAGSIDLLGSSVELNDAKSSVTLVCTDGVWIQSSNSSSSTGGVFASSVKDFGAVGNGVTNDTAAVQSACNSSGVVFFPSGTYMLNQISVTTKCRIILDPAAVVKLRSITAGQDQAIFRFSGSSTYSSVEGGSFDGNRTALAGNFTSQQINAVRIAGPAYINVSNTYIHDFSNAGWYCGSSQYALFENIHVKNCGKGCIHQVSDNGTVQNIVFEGISNNSKPIYQHATEFRDSDNFVLKDIRIVDFAPDSVGLEPTATAFTLERMDRLEASGLVATGFSGTGKPGLGAVFDSITMSSVRGISIDGGYDSGMAVQTCSNSILDGGNINLEYNTAASAGTGVRIRNGGLYDPVTDGATNLNARANSGCFNLKLSNYLVIAAEGDGYLLQSGGVALDSCVAIGCGTNGFKVTQGLVNSFFPGGDAIIPEYVVVNSCEAAYCGSMGLSLDYGKGLSVVGGSYHDNGQNVSLPPALRSGIRIVNVQDVSLVGVDSSDTQGWPVEVDGVSFQPDTTARNIYPVSLMDPTRFNFGQHIRVFDAGGSGVDAIGKIIGKDRDEVTLEMPSPFTFSASATSSSLSGLYDSTGFNLTGNASANLVNEVKGRTWIVGTSGVWSQIIRVSSAAAAVISPSFIVDKVSSALIKNQANVGPIQSQQSGVRVDATASGVFFSGFTGTGNVSALYTIVSASSIRSIQRSSGDILDVISTVSGLITIPYGRELLNITGSNGIIFITPGFVGQELTLVFSGSLTVSDGLNMRLAGDFVATPGDTLCLVCDGVNWIELSRSDNG